MVVGRSESLLAVITLATQVGASRAATVLVTGETGTGKELFARGIHSCSAMSSEPFVAINCAAIPETLLESELFGHERGAFTDARTLKRGLLEVAGCGTIFLDEVGELPLKLQPKLLRVLEQRTFRRVGGSAELPIKARVIAGTNVSLADAVDRGDFREDLFYRLSVVRVDLPPLRERTGDIEILARHFLRELARETDGVPATLSADAIAALCNHNWPGNVRELKNVIERAVIVAEGKTIQSQQLLFQRRRSVQPGSEPENRLETGSVIRIPLNGKTLDEIEREAIHATLLITRGNLSATARILGISRPTLDRKLRSAGLERRMVVSSQ
ncbi:MAG: sigma-54 dependent transcriptional regulator [Gemmatimonadota bacterium]|nr:sigma-54 dependent transcriptional regulator [Gemmatimonadota bacterium]